jgi:hypothetical protein
MHKSEKTIRNYLKKKECLLNSLRKIGWLKDKQQRREK